MPLSSLALKHANPGHSLFQWAMDYFKPMLLPVLVAIVPTLYHYSNNVAFLILLNLYQMLFLNTLLAVIVYFLLMTFNRFQGVKSAIGALVFLVYFNIYGLVYKYLLDVDIIAVKHYTLLPFILMLAFYSILVTTRFKSALLLTIWRNLFLVVSVLVLLNLASIIYAEIKRWTSSAAFAPDAIQGNISLRENSPDIYYIILDEFVGFQGMRDYWGYEEVDDFVDFLKERGFFIAEETYGNSTGTVMELASRLNYREYPLETEPQTYFNHIAENRVMRYLKSQGYTTVVFYEMKSAYPASEPIQADYVYEIGGSSIPQGNTGLGLLDEFGELVMGNTMFSLIPKEYYGYSTVNHPHSNLIRFTVENVTVKDIPSPKFVYVHLLVPHSPFMFTPNGEVVERHYTDWNYYLDNYKFSIKIAREMIDKILLASGADNPPVIILQSDHGARNQAKAESIPLPNYPEEYKTLIMYTLYLPGYDYSTLPQSINPINTFPIVFNHLFDANIPLVK